MAFGFATPQEHVIGGYGKETRKEHNPARDTGAKGIGSNEAARGAVGSDPDDSNWDCLGRQLGVSAALLAGRAMDTNRDS
jgi:hypothetical protein